MTAKSVTRTRSIPTTTGWLAAVILAAVLALAMLGMSACTQQTPGADGQSSSGSASAGAAGSADASTGATGSAGASASASTGASSAASSASASSSAEASSASASSPEANGKEDDVYGELLEAKYSDSGNSLGNLYTLEVLRDESGTLIVRESESPMHNEPIEVREFSAPDDLLDQIAAIIDRVDAKHWGELPLSEFIVFDAATESLNLTYDSTEPDGYHEWLSISMIYELPEGGADAFREIRDLMLACATDDNLINQYTQATR